MQLSLLDILVIIILTQEFLYILQISWLPRIQRSLDRINTIDINNDIQSISYDVFDQFNFTHDILHKFGLICSYTV